MVGGMTNHTPDRPVADQPTVRLRPEQPSDVLDLVPILLGFHPTDSLVMMVLQEGTVALTARIDLGIGIDPGTCEEFEELGGDETTGPVARLDSLGLRMAEIAVQHEATGVILVGYAQDAELAGLALHRAVLAQPPTVEIVDVICVDRERWWSLVCPCADCDGEGTRYEAGGGRLAAEAVYAGVPLRVFGDREQKKATVCPPAVEDRPGLQSACRALAEGLGDQPLEGRVTEMVDRVDSFRAGVELTDADCVRLAVLASSIEVRDAAWAQFSRPDAERMCDLWGQVVRRAVAPYELAPLCLLGLASWLAGDGALQVMCFERALAIDPGYSLARLLEQLNERAVPPSLWDELAPEVRALSAAER